MKKRKGLQPTVLSPPKPLTLEERLRRYRASPRPKLRKRLVHAASRQFGHIVTLRGAVKSAGMRKLAALRLDDILTEDKLTVIRDPKWLAKKKEASS